MLLNNLDIISNIITQKQFSIFAFPAKQSYPDISATLVFSPNEKAVIPIENVRQISKIVRNKQSNELVVLFLDAEQLTEAASNSFLKILEEPGEHIHFVFFTHAPQKLPLTVLSRASNYQIPDKSNLSMAPEIKPEILALAKQYIAAGPRELELVIQNFSSDRTKAIQVLSASIDILYRSYFITPNPKFLEKLAALNKTYDAIKQNGHLKLQLIAGML